jgi:CHASE2 domain-containing sensor protein
MSTNTSPKPPSARRKWIFRIALALFASLLEEGYELFERFTGHQEPPSAYTLATHRVLTTPLFFTPLAQNTAAIIFPAQDLLVRRGQIAELIPRLADARAAAILLDFTFTPGEILDKHPNTLQLRQAVKEWSSKIPILRVCSDASAESANLPEAQREAISQSNAVALEPVLSLKDHHGQEIPCGLATFNIDTRKLPIGFAVQTGPAQTQFEASQFQSSLSYRAALLRVPELQERVKSISPIGFHPFANFLKRQHLRELSSQEALAKPIPDLTALLTGRLAFIGADDASDRHPTPVGDLPGVLLHVNYTEAILDNRIYFGVHWAIVFLVNLIVFTALDIVCEHLPLLKAIGILAAFLAAWFFLTNISVFVLHYYLPLSLPTYPFIILKWLRIEQRLKGH